MDLWLLGFSFVLGVVLFLFRVFLTCFVVPVVFVEFLLVVNLNGSGLWDLEKIR